MVCDARNSSEWQEFFCCQIARNFAEWIVESSHDCFLPQMRRSTLCSENRLMLDSSPFKSYVIPPSSFTQVIRSPTLQIPSPPVFLEGEVQFQSVFMRKRSPWCCSRLFLGENQSTGQPIGENDFSEVKFNQSFVFQM